MPLTRRRALTVFFLAVVLGALALWPSAQRQGTGPAKGRCDETTCVLPDSAPLSIALMNIRRGRGLDDEKDLGRTAECLKGSQLIALNEVGGADDATELASLLSLAPLFAASERFFWQEDFGNALLSPTPPQSWERIPLPYADEGGWRNLLIARWPIGDRQLTVMITHLDRGSARTRQLAQVIELFRAAPAPKVLLGDLNSHRGEPLLAALLADPTLSVADPGEENRIDWIIGQGMTFSAVRVCDVGASDHPALLTQMIISP